MGGAHSGALKKPRREQTGSSSNSHTARLDPYIEELATPGLATCLTIPGDLTTGDGDRSDRGYRGSYSGNGGDGVATTRMAVCLTVPGDLTAGVWSGSYSDGYTAGDGGGWGSRYSGGGGDRWSGGYSGGDGGGWGGGYSGSGWGGHSGGSGGGGGWGGDSGGDGGGNGGD